MWNVQGQWIIHQAPKTTVTVDLIQAPTDPPGDLTGDINGNSAKSVTPGGPTLSSNSVHGAIIGNQFFLSISWSDGSVGEYNGVFGIPPTNTPTEGTPVEGQNSRLWGVSTDSQNLQNVSAWVS